MDIGLEKGTPIKVPVDGVVTGVDTGHVQGENNFGNSVNVKAKNGDTFQFHHLDKVLVGLGQKVKKGQKIMTGGDSGATYSPTGRDPSNLDMRIVNAYNKYKNPTKYIRSL